MERPRLFLSAPFVMAVTAVTSLGCNTGGSPPGADGGAGEEERTTMCAPGVSPPSGADDAAPYGCSEALPGPHMIEAHLPNGDPFCIDATEVTYAQYQEFLAAEPCTTSPDCAGNSTFVPTRSPPDERDRPVHDVDWCDARAYCRWAGKRLCHDVGNDEPIDASEWWSACSRAGERAFPYGNEFVDGVCGQLEEGPWVGRTHPAGAFPSCQGGFDGLFDMVGNVSEWTDHCEVPVSWNDPSTYCFVRGGNYVTVTLSEPDCKSWRKGLSSGHTGIRCCRDALPP